MAVPSPPFYWEAGFASHTRWTSSFMPATICKKSAFSQRKIKQIPGVYHLPREAALWKDSFQLGCWRDLGYAPRVCSTHLRFSAAETNTAHLPPCTEPTLISSTKSCWKTRTQEEVQMTCNNRHVDCEIFWRCHIFSSAACKLHGPHLLLVGISLAWASKFSVSKPYC
jgi:hypothetical protein